MQNDSGVLRRAYARDLLENDFLAGARRLFRCDAVRPVLHDFAVMSHMCDGGMSGLFRGINLKSGVEAVLKVCRPRTPKMLERFRREAEVMHALPRFGTPRIFDQELRRPPYFIAMTYFKGMTVEEHFKLAPRGCLRWAEVFKLMLSLARVLSRCHRRGIVHRDIKDSNVLIKFSDRDARTSDFQEAVLLDFGLALSFNLHRLSRTGEVNGTPLYMPPGGLLYPRSTAYSFDVYSAGAMAYELLAGRPLLRAGNLHATLAQVCNLRRTHVPLCQLAPEVPREFCGIIENCVELLPEHRYASADELLIALEEFKAGLFGAVA